MYVALTTALTPMMVLFSCILIGVLLRRLNLVPADTVNVLGKLEYWVFTPALVFNTYIQNCTAENLFGNIKLPLYTTLFLPVAMLCAGFLSGLLIKEGYNRGVFKYALVFSNYGNVGYPLVQALMGSEGLYYFMLFVMPLSVVCNSWGVQILVPKGENSGGVLKRIFNPILVALLFGAALGLTGLNRHIPTFASNTLSNLGACMAPVAMILTGLVIGERDLKGLLGDKRVYIATFLRLIMLPTVFVGLFMLLGAEPMVLYFVFFAFAMPLGLNTVIFPAAFGIDNTLGASMAVVSHSLAVITIPLMYSLLTAIIA